MEIGIPWFVKPGIYRLETKMCLIVWLEWCGGSLEKQTSRKTMNSLMLSLMLRLENVQENKIYRVYIVVEKY